MKKLVLILAIGFIASGCATMPELNNAMIRIDNAWKQKNDDLRREIGTASIDATTDEAFDATLSTFRKLGLSIQQEDREQGLIFGVAPAPTPLTEAEWQEAKKIDGPGMRKIAGETLPISSLFFMLHTDQVEINVLAAIAPLSRGAEVSFQYTMVDHKVLNMGLHAAENPPPTAAKIGMIKAWKEFEVELKKVQAGG